MKVDLPRLHAFTDERIARRPDLRTLVQALAAGAPPASLAVHARGHTLSGREHYDLARRLRPEPANGMLLFVNDRLDVALAVGAMGVQLTRASLEVADARRLGPQWLVGRSVHALAEARAARAEGADYLVVGPVFATASHPDAALLGLEGLGRITALGIPVVAIGGITIDRARAVRASGAYGVAAIHALWDAPDPAGAAAALAEAMT